MFAEELGGRSCARKRQDQARERRRKAKEDKRLESERRERYRLRASQNGAGGVGGGGVVGSSVPSGSAAGPAASSTAPSSAGTATANGGGGGEASVVSAPSSRDGKDGGVAVAVAAPAASAGEGTTTAASSLPPAAPPKPSTTTIASSSSATSSSRGGQQPSAVSIALEQRKLRSIEKLRVASAIKIQSSYRAFRSNVSLVKSERESYDRRMQDLTTLGAVLKKARGLDAGDDGGPYVPPPATATRLAAQMLFLARAGGAKKAEAKGNASSAAGAEKKKKIDGGADSNGFFFVEAKDYDRFDSLLNLAILPGLLGDDPDLDPILPWLQSFEGKVRLRKLLGLAVRRLTRRPPAASIDEAASSSSSDRFLRAALGTTLSPSRASGSGERTTARDSIVSFCRSILLSPVPPSPDFAAATHDPPVAPSLDLIRSLRTLLLYDTAGPNPIPPDAEKLRERCVPTRDRDRADRVFRLAYDAVVAAPGSEAASPSLRGRFVAEFFTIPLLTWKVSPGIISHLVTSKEEGSSFNDEEPPFVSFLRSFAAQHGEALSNSTIGSTLPSKDVPMTVCPASNVLCLLANLIQIGRICPSINGSDVSFLNYKAATVYFDVLTSLLDVVPLGTYSSRRSAVEWITVDSTSIPVVLSSVVIDQCRSILVDSYVRDLFRAAINDEKLGGTDRILSKKDEKDVKQEKEMAEVGATSASALAAKEAMVDRTKGFWQSKWAKKLSKTVSSFMSGESSPAGHPAAVAHKKKPSLSSSLSKGGGKLLNTSSISRQLANGGKSGSGRGDTAAAAASVARAAALATEDGERKAAGGGRKEEAKMRPSASSYDPSFLFALCRAYGSILSRWGGGGNDDLVRRETTAPSRTASWEEQRAPDETDAGKRKKTKTDASAKAEPCALSLLNVICFATNVVRALWAVVQSNGRIVSDVYSVIDSEKSETPIRSLTIRPSYRPSSAARHGPTMNANAGDGAAVLFLFVSCLSHVLIVTDDCEIHDMDRPLPVHQIRRCVLVLKKLLYRACCVDDVVAHPAHGRRPESDHFGLALIAASSRTMRDLYDRSSRRPLCLPKTWIVEDLLERDLKRCESRNDYVDLLSSSPVLRVCPFLVSYKRRLRLFERIVTTDRIEVQGCNERHNLKPGVVVRITRGRVLEDGLIHLNNLGRNMRQRIVVQYLNQAGATETGVDVGGLFKEFWTDLSNIAFDPNYALFRATEGSGNCLYPNPSSRAAHGSDHVVLFEFLGRILGKALYEGITIQPQFAHFFLSFLKGDYNFLHMLPDLSTMDPQLYNNLMFLKTYEGDAADLCLNFTVANDDFGGNQEVSLIPNGANVEVTNANKQRYIGLVAKHHVCDRVKEQSQAFTRGLWEVIDRSWLRLFNEPELQVLISGASDGKIDVADMKANARYTGGYTGLDRNVHRFWNVVSSLTGKQQSDLLRFVTSCERPPPLGFRSMNPPFTIQRVYVMRDAQKLPTASTCFNTLKLPTYSSERVLRERLIYAIEAGAGFELT